MELIIMISQFILSLSILIVLHEFGHFLPARLFGIRVEKFYLFFNPYFSLFKKQIGETEWGIGWLPLGGYVKIAGMMDESFDKEQMAQPVQDWEFRAKPAWQRLIVMVGGVTVNFILGFLLWGLVVFTWGEKHTPVKNLKDGLFVGSFAKEMGLQNGDNIISVGGQPLSKFEALRREIIIGEAETMTVEREGNTVVIPITREHRQALSGRDIDFVYPRIPFVAGKIVKDSPAEEAGLMKGDSILAINDTPTPFFDQFKYEASQRANESIKVHVVRAGSKETIEMTLDSCGRMGVAPIGPDRFIKQERTSYGFGAAMAKGFNEGRSFLMDNIRGFALMFKGSIKAKDSLGGFGTIANLFPSKWEWERFWKITAILSLILGFMNLLPIPLLDGGHVMFLFYEMITGKEPSEKFLEYAQTAGLIFIFGLLIFANGMDILRGCSGGAVGCG